MSRQLRPTLQPIALSAPVQSENIQTIAPRKAHSSSHLSLSNIFKRWGGEARMSGSVVNHHDLWPEDATHARASLTQWEFVEDLEIVKKRLSHMHDDDLKLTLMATQKMVADEITQRKAAVTRPTIKTETQCFGKNITIVDNYTENYPIELECRIKTSLDPHIVADHVCPCCSRRLYSIWHRYFKYWMIVSLTIGSITGLFEADSIEMFSVTFVCLASIGLSVLPILHVEIVIELLKRWETLYFLLMAAIFSITDAYYTSNAYGYDIGFIVGRKVASYACYSMAVFIDAVPDVLLTIRGKMFIIILFTVNCSYWSVMMTISESFWVDKDMTFHFSKEWLLSDIYTATWLSMTCMMLKHTAHVILMPHKFVILSYGPERKHADKELAWIIQRINDTGHKRDAYIDAQRLKTQTTLDSIHSHPQQRTSWAEGDDSTYEDYDQFAISE